MGILGVAQALAGNALKRGRGWWVGEAGGAGTAREDSTRHYRPAYERSGRNEPKTVGERAVPGNVDTRGWGGVVGGPMGPKVDSEMIEMRQTQGVFAI